MEREALKLALEALEAASRIMDATAQQRQDDAITAINKALAQPAQEPWPEEPAGHMAGGVQPPQRPWVEPTGNEWFEWWRVSQVAHETEAEIDFADFLIIAQAVAAKLKERNA